MILSSLFNVSLSDLNRPSGLQENRNFRADISQNSQLIEQNLQGTLIWGFHVEKKGGGGGDVGKHSII